MLTKAAEILPGLMAAFGSDKRAQRKTLEAPLKIEAKNLHDEHVLQKRQLGSKHSKILNAFEKKSAEKEGGIEMIMKEEAKRQAFVGLRVRKRFATVNTRICPQHACVLFLSSQASLHVNWDNLFLTLCDAIHFQGAFYGGVVTKKRSLELTLCDAIHFQGAFYGGVVTKKRSLEPSCSTSSMVLFHVLYDDGDDEEVELAELKQMRLEVRHGVTVHSILARDQKVSCKYM